MDDRPNVQVIYTQAPTRAPGFLAIVAETIAFVVFLALLAIAAALTGRL